jgi:hypothetical protein
VRGLAWRASRPWQGRARLRVQGVGLRVWGAGFSVVCLQTLAGACQAKGSGFRAQDLGCRV